MSDKSTSATGAFFALPGLRVVTLQGRDAARYAQAQFMSDVAALADGHWHWSGWLQPKGRVIALFALLKFDPERLWLAIPDADAEQVAERLSRFVFRSKAHVEVEAGLHASGAFAAGAARGAEIAMDGDEVLLDLGGDGGPRSLRLSTASAADDAAAVARWNGFDLAHGLPRLPPSQAEQWTPQQLSLARLGAYSVKKGCYPGQEIVARTHFLGQAKRGLVRLDTETTTTAGDAVVADGRDVGGVICAQERIALAVLPLERDDAPLTIAGAPARIEPLLGGLAR